MKWGMRGFEKLERQRPEFAMNLEIKLTNSPIDGSKFAYFPAHKRKIRRVLTSGVVFVFILLVLCGILAIFLFKAFTDPNQCAAEIVDDDDFDDATGFVKGQEYGIPTMRCVDGIWSNLRIGPYFSSSGDVVVPEIPLGIVIATILTSVNILVWNRIYAVVSVHLNDYENHRTDTEYEDALISKTLSFQMVNSYGALMYIAFVKEPVVNKLEFLDLYAMCPYSQGSNNMGRSCVSEVGLQLFSIFVVNMIISTLLSIGLPFLQQYKSTWSRCAEVKDDACVEAENTNERLKSATEQEFDLGDYGELMGLFSDYAELAIQFGYATIFTVAFPAAPLMALLNNLCQIRFDFYKITIQSRRVVPRGAEDIGTWEHLFHMMSTVAIVSNCALVVFAGHYLKDYQQWLPFKAVGAPANKWLLFVLLEHTLLLGRIFLALWIDDIPQDVVLQMSRQDLIVSKLIDDAESDDEETHEKSCFSLDNVTDPTIADVDDEFWLPPGIWNAPRPDKATTPGRVPQNLKSAQRRETGAPESKDDFL
jgi:anoctamin-10/anoctamin-7